MARLYPLQMLLLATSSCLIPALSSASQYVQVLNVNGVISVKATNVTARTIVEELNNKLDIDFIVSGDAETRLNLDIVQEPLSKALPKLSPNNLIVRENSDSNSQIIEVVLMLGGSSSSSSSNNNEQFLPTGSPAAETQSEVQEIQAEADSDQLTFTDPDHAKLVRQAADAAAYDSRLPPDQVPPMFAE